MNTEKNEITKLKDAANIVYLSGENCRITKEGDFIAAEITSADGTQTSYNRVWLHRSFPFDMPWNYISVQDKDGEEIGLIRNVDDFDECQKSLLQDELRRKYFAPKIEKILSLKEARGISFWKCTTDAGELSFTVQDTYRSISKAGGGRVYVTDVCGNRFEIESIDALDKKSRRKIELYL